MVSLSDMFPNTVVRAQVSAMLDAPRGIVALTGGDASGKSTSLFCLGQELRARGKPCTVLIQDPAVMDALQPEYFTGHDIRCIGAADAQLQPELDAAGDKGIVIIDELDYRNARQLVDLAKKGATLFTMIHTPFVGIDCGYTLQKMGIEPDEFLQAFSCLASQMLAPALCRHCREPVNIDVAQAQTIDPSAHEPMQVWKEVGCAQCRQDGPRKGTIGMLALHEVLMIDDHTRPVLADYLDKGDLRNPLPQGHITMQQDGRDMVRRGELGFGTYKREITQNPTLRMQHQWELERRHGENVTERLTKLRRFFSPSVAELILSGSVDDPLKTRRREIVVVFLDLRNFTAFAETSDPEDVMRVLGDYHAAMGELVMSHGGTLERFAGDGMMVFLNDPVQVDDPAHDAVHMAAHMQRRFDEVRKGWKKLGIDLQLGIGVAQGYATIGAIGFEGRRDYGAIGVVTNLAARLCAEAQGGQILVSQRVFGAIEEKFTTEAVGPLTLKGFRAPVEAFAVNWRA